MVRQTSGNSQSGQLGRHWHWVRRSLVCKLHWVPRLSVTTSAHRSDLPYPDALDSSHQNLSTGGATMPMVHKRDAYTFLKAVLQAQWKTWYLDLACIANVNN